MNPRDTAFVMRLLRTLGDRIDALEQRLAQALREVEQLKDQLTEERAA